MIDHIIVLSCFHLRSYPVRQVLTVEFWFRHRPNLYDRSCRCPIRFSSQSEPSLISHGSSISFSMQTTFVQLVSSCPIQFSTQSTPDSIDHDSSVSFFVQVTLVRSIMSLSYLVLVTDGTQSNQLQQLNLVFDVNHIFTISHVLVLSSYHQSHYTIQAVTIVEQS